MHRNHRVCEGVPCLPRKKSPLLSTLLQARTSRLHTLSCPLEVSSRMKCKQQPHMQIHRSRPTLQNSQISSEWTCVLRGCRNGSSPLRLVPRAGQICPCNSFGTCSHCLSQRGAVFLENYMDKASGKGVQSVLASLSQGIEHIYGTVDGAISVPQDAIAIKHPCVVLV